MRLKRPLSWSDLCTGCGTCLALCPKDIEMVLDPRSNYTPILKNECSFCGTCNAVCPVPIDPLVTKTGLRKDLLIGKYINCYMGHSRHRGIRWRASSGGVITSILMFMLKESIVDGVLTVKMEHLKPTPFIAKNSKELLSAMGSKYFPVPLNAKLKDLLELKGRFAIVGLPCHVRGIRNVTSVSRELRERIPLVIGLFCSRTITPIGVKTLLHKLHIHEDDVEEISFRGRGWPGQLYVRLRNGNEIFFPFFMYWRPLYSTYFFTPTSCLFCSDMTNEQADISFGDAWLPEISRIDTLGTSIVISRTEMGEEILRGAWRAGFIELEELDFERVLRSQWRPLFFKKVTLPARQMLSKHTRKYILQIDPIQLICALVQLANKKISDTSIGQHVIERLPFSLLEAYAFISSRVENITWRCTKIWL